MEASGDRAAVGGEAAVQDIDEGGFPRAVVADEADAFAGPDGEVDAVEGHDMAIGLDDVAGLEHDLGRRVDFRCGDERGHQRLLRES